MALVNRQNNLFAAEDWRVAYKAFSEIDLQAYDFDTIRRALIEYVTINFPENFNDYTESSEFVAIIELLAYLSQSIAFRMDVNTRENFLETAERRDSVFKLARMLGYNPRRNIAANGLLKVDAVRTTENLQDSSGNPLNNIDVFFDDANNPDGFEQFIVILNGAMSSSNRYTNPVKTGRVGDVPTEIYELQTRLDAPTVYPFRLNINGTQMNFEVVNPEFEDGGVFTERHPDSLNNFNLIYRNDGRGISSDQTGFFLMFKQGTLETRNFDYQTPLESRIHDIEQANINEDDVWLQELSPDGFILNRWQRVPNTVGQTLTYNDLANDERNLYAIENLDHGGIRLKFPDGNFGNVPVGRFRLFTRYSTPTRFSVSPSAARNVVISIPYENSAGEEHTLSLTCSLRYTVRNSLPPETLAAIKERAPQTYYSQNRMISSQDYNVFPLSQSSNLTKMKAINRTHAGHSRYIDINDPTGTYQNLETFANDGAIYSEIRNQNSSIRISDNNTVLEVLQHDVPLILRKTNLNNFVYNRVREERVDRNDSYFDLSTYGIVFRTLPVVSGKSYTGSFVETSSTGDGVESGLDNRWHTFKMFQENNFFKFVNPADPTEYTWARITRIDNNGLLSSTSSNAIGPVRLSDRITHDWQVTEFVGTMRKEFVTSNVIRETQSDSAGRVRTERAHISQQLENRNTFGLGYDLQDDLWYVITNENLNRTGEWSSENEEIRDETHSESGNMLNASWLLLFEFVGTTNGVSKYNIITRGQEYIVESKNDLKFYNIQNSKVLDTNNAAGQDLITFTTLNFKPGNSEIFTWNGTSFVSSETNSQYTPNGYETKIPLRARSTRYYDVDILWKTNLGIFQNGDSTGDNFVNFINIPIQTGNERNGSDILTTNITLANNSGVIDYWPGVVDIDFDSDTFGYNIFSPTTSPSTFAGQIVYKDINPITNAVEIYRAKITTDGTVETFSYGANNNDAEENRNAPGRIQLLSVESLDEGTGRLRINNWNENRHTNVRDSRSLSRDQLIVNYKFNKENLDRNIDWTVVAPVKYSDGYTDNRKIIVQPFDSDGDLVPDRPLQFREFVSTNDLVFFEYYSDFDGYRYNRPFNGNIEDLGQENSIDVVLRADRTGTVSPGSRSDPKELADINLVIIKEDSLMSEFENNRGAFNGLLLYSRSSGDIFQMTKQSTNINQVLALKKDDTEYFVRNGRAAEQNTATQSDDEIIFRWKHVAPKDVRIDPSVSNIVEMLILTTNYNEAVQRYKRVPDVEFPFAPTSAELANEFRGLDEFKAASDTLVFRSASFKRLFGADAEPSVQARFRVTRVRGSTLSNNEVKSRIITAMDTYFNVENWEFGETFNFSELSAYIHQRIGTGVIGSIVIVPRNGKFGDLFQVKAEPNELFLHTATVNDIEIIERIDTQTLSVGGQQDGG